MPTSGLYTSNEGVRCIHFGYALQVAFGWPQEVSE